MDDQEEVHCDESAQDQEADVTTKLHAFIQKFITAFGENAPPFVSAGLGEAVRQAFLKQPHDRKPLALYLHRDALPTDGPATTPFCLDILTEPAVKDTLTNSFIVWGWDLTDDSELNRNQLLNAVSVFLGGRTAKLIGGLTASDLPALITLFYGNGHVEVDSVIASSGSLEVSRILSHLAATILKNEEMNCVANPAAQDESKKVNANHASVPLAMVLVKFKLPLGNTLETRFQMDQKFGIIVSFLNQEGYDLSTYRLVLFSPRRDMSEVDPEKRLLEFHFGPLEHFILEERNQTH